MTPAIELSFRYSENDYVRAFQAHFSSKHRLWLDVVVAVITLALGINLLSSSSRWLGVVAIVAVACLALVRLVAGLVVPRLIFRREPKFRDDYFLTFSSDGIHFRTTHINSQLQWSMYSEALIVSQSYILCYGSRQFTVIPKRVFSSTEQQQAFEQLLTQNVPKIIRRNA